MVSAPFAVICLLLTRLCLTVKLYVVMRSFEWVALEEA